MKTSTSLLSIVLWYTTALTAFPYTITLVPGFTMVANHFNHVPNNRLANFFQPPPPDGCAVYVFDKAIQNYRDPYTYIDGFGWFSSSDPDPDGPIINPGEGFFFQNVTATAFTRTITGAVVSPVPVTLPLNSYCIVANQAAAAGGYQAIIGSPPQAGFCTRMYRWNPALQQFNMYSSPGTLTATFPVVAVGESVFLIRASADTTPPKLVNATINIGGGTILLEFSESMNPGPATLLANYVLTGGPGTLTSAAMFPITTPPPTDSKFVQLNATGLNGSFVYKLAISGLTDLCGNLIDSCTQVGLNCTAPANDLCANATVAVNGLNPMGTTICSSTDGYSVCDNICPGGDVWYQYAPSGNGTVTFETCNPPTSTTMDTILSVWNGCPGNTPATELIAGCDDDACSVQSSVTLNVTSCGTYYIRVSGSQGAFGNFFLNVTFTPSAPANDLCANPTVLGSANGVFPFTTVNANTDGPLGLGSVRDIWYSYTPSCGGPVYVSTCGSSFNTALSVYTTCGGLALASNDDALTGACAPSLQSFLTFTATAATTYLIRVGSAPSLTVGGCGQLVIVGPNSGLGCPPGVPPIGTGAAQLHTRFFEVTGNSSGTPWAWSIRAPCCFWVQNLSVPAVPAGSPPSALVSAFVASINAPCPPLPCGTCPPNIPNRLTAQGAGPFMLVSVYGCLAEPVFTVGPAGTASENQCVIPNPADFLPTSGPCSFNPPIREIPLSKRDCNTNGVDDLVDVIAGTSTDWNGNRIPDECETCPRPGFVIKPAAQQAKHGQSATFTAQGQGTDRLTYQWLFNGALIPGATESKLVIDPVRSTDAGNYQVVIADICGEKRSALVPLTLVGERLRIQFRNGRVEVHWDATNVVLQSAAEVDGTWTTLDNAVSPVIISPPTKQEFFRLLEE